MCVVGSLVLQCGQLLAFPLHYLKIKLSLLNSWYWEKIYYIFFLTHSLQKQQHFLIVLDNFYVLTYISFLHDMTLHPEWLYHVFLMIRIEISIVGVIKNLNSRFKCMLSPKNLPTWSFIFFVTYLLCLTYKGIWQSNPSTFFLNRLELFVSPGHVFHH